ncbi:ABC transporter permease [Rothia sp. LK2588]|uniref:ABC transporter permease n=1 Tax=Rothia sp. LK2588 TaxID=3114369 RepID=UPI0034CF864D
MFLGIRDIFFAKGRFALIASVVGLLTLLLVMLTGLTGGLGNQNTAALKSLNADRIVFGATGSGEPEVSYTSSVITEGELKQWREDAAMKKVEPVGISQTKIETTDHAGSVAVFGVPSDSGLVEQTAGGVVAGTATPADDEVVLASSTAEDLKLSTGDKVNVGGTDFTVAGIVRDTYYSHTPVIFANTAGWTKLSHQAPRDGGADQQVVGTVLAVQAPEATDDQFTHRADATDTRATTVKESFDGLAAYKSEQGSLKAMQGFLYGISALVTISFLTVWTIQRTRDLAVLRALGSTTGYLLRDALIQAAIVLAAGAIAGALIGWGLGALASGTVPFALTPLTVIGPAAGIWVLGILGSLIATARVTKIDPMIALGGN